MTPPASPAEHSGAEPRLHVRTADLLAARIADGTLPPGTLLLASRIATMLGTSRGPARQALATLEARGLVMPTPRGHVVAGVVEDRAPAEGGLASLGGQRLVQAASWERLYPEIERAIVARTAFSGWRLVEVELAAHYDVSRTVVREVIARLHQRGLLRRDDRGRWIAPALTAAHVGELYEVRALLEPAALQQAASRLAPGFVARLRARLEAAIVRAATLDGPALDELEADLHVRLLGHCPNETLMEAVRLHQSLLVAHSFLYAFAPRLYPTEPFLPEHREILERLEAGHADAAAAALRCHLQASLARAVARVEQVRLAPPPAPLPYLQPLPGGG